MRRMRMRSELSKFTATYYSASAYSVMLYGSHTWSVKGEYLIRLEKNNGRVVKWIYTIKPEDRIFAEDFRTRLHLNSMREYLQDRRLK